MQNKSLVQKAFFPQRENLTHQTTAGVGITFLGVAIRLITTIASTAILSRLLKPSEFGEMAMAASVTELTSLLGNFGFQSILIQKKRISRLDIDTIFWAGLIVSLLLAAVVFVLSTYAGLYFNNDGIKLILRMSALYFIFEGLRTVHAAIIYRLMLFKLDFYLQTIGLIARMGGAIYFAWQGYGVLSLVLGPILYHVLMTIAMWSLIRYLPRFKFNLDFVKRYRKIGISYIGSGFLFYCNMNFDLVLIGRILGATELGYYQASRSLTDEIRARITAPLQNVLFPALSLLQSDRARFQRAVLRTMSLLALIVSPLGIGLAAVAPELVQILYGQRWLAMIEILPYIALAGTLRATLAIASTIFNAANKVDVSLRLNTVNTLIFLLAIWIGSHWGIIGVAQGNLFSSCAYILVALGGYGIIGLTLKDLLKALLPSYAASFFMYACLELSRMWIWPNSLGALAWEMPDAVLGLWQQFTQGSLNGLETTLRRLFNDYQSVFSNTLLPTRFAVLVTIGILSYLVAIILFSRATFNDALQVLVELRKRRSKS